MKFSARLMLILLPFILIPPLIVASLFRVYAVQGMEGLSIELIGSQLENFQAQTRAEYAVLQRLRLDLIDFYVLNSQRKVLSLAAEFELVGSGTLFILDSAGTPLYPSAEQLEMSAEVRERLLTDPGAFEGYAADRGLKSNRYIVRAVLFEPWGWILGVRSSKAEILRPITNATVGAGAVFLVISLLSVLILIFFAQGIARPILALVETTRRMGGGDLAARARVSSGDELGTLAAAYNEMADKLQELNTNLERRVAARTRELENSLAVLRQTQGQLVEKEKMAALGSLVAGIAHEINTPLGVGVTASSFLKRATEEVRQGYHTESLSRGDFEQHLKTTAESCEIIERNLERAHGLIRSFKQLAIDQSSEESRSFAVAAYLNDIIRSLKPEFRGYNVSITVDCSETVEMHAPPGLLAQVVTNLIMNSLIHGFGTGGEGRITLGVRKVGEVFHLVYIDNGRGMDFETLKHLYEPFYTTRRGQGGSGLGMNIVYNIVTTRLRGSIEVDSQPDQGVRYDIRIPVDQG